MWKQGEAWVAQPSHFIILPNLSKLCTPTLTILLIPKIHALKLSNDIHGQALCLRCTARRRVRYEDEDGEGDDDYGHNEEIAMLELYSQSARDEALLVHALLYNQQVQVLIFKGFSSCLSYKTSADPSRSVIPGRAVIKSIDRIKGPFDPSDVQYLEQGLTWEAFKSRFPPDIILVKAAQFIIPKLLNY